jgi:Zn-dependent protease with chaperone function
MTGLIALKHAAVTPGFLALAVVVTLATFGAHYLVIRAIARILHPRSSDDSGRLFVHGIGPTLVACAIALGVVLPAFLLFEPAHDGEAAGVLLMVLALVGFVHIGRVILRAARMLRLSRSIIAAWTRAATPLERSAWGLPVFAIDAGFPVVAVAGLFRPRLFIDRRVLSSCTAGELAAIAAHERAHVERYDNLRRLLIGACEGPASDAAAEWRRTAELAADRRAASSPRRGVDLASALLKIACLAPGHTLDATALSTIHDGGSLETRVRQLVATEQRALAEQHTSSAVWLTLVPLALVAGLNWSALLRSAHALTEAAVRHLP